jgi:hypothetical protein
MPDPLLYPTPYSPGQIAFNNNAELSQLVTMFAGPLLGSMAGPGNFVPHMMPGQALMDQFAMRNYQNQTRNASLNLAQAGPQNQDVANRLLGIRSMFTGSAATDMNREQAMQMAQVLNNPMTKTFAGMMMGAENVEMMLHGSRGDVQSLGNTVNRLGYFQKDPSGNNRMDANSLEDLTTGVFSHLYEPQGDTEKLAATARAGGDAGLAATQRLQKAANMEHVNVVSDAAVQKRLEDAGAPRVDALYKKYVQGGTATDTATQAKELTKFDRAIKESRVLLDEEATIGQLETAAFKQPTAEMRGLTAGQAGQLMENLFQRGVLPQTVGNLDAKGKVSAIAETKLDDATLQRLAETMARRQLTEKNETNAAGKKFTDMTATEQKQEIEALANKQGGTKEQINATRAEAERTARGGVGAKSAEDVMQMVGGEALASNVDASRVSSRIKDYADSIAAVRDIFGDNGNSNAPMPALMAALDHLTQGGMGRINPAQMATTLRQMQSMARDTGTGMQQLAAISAQAGAMGQQLGIAPSITMQNVAMSMGLTKTATERGSFSNNAPGGMSREQFQQEAVTRLQQGDASDNAKAMAAMRRVYQADPEKFKGTELEAAVTQGYEDRASGGKYTYKGEERNLFEQIGRFGVLGAQKIIAQSGAGANDFHAAFHDPRTMTEEFAIAGGGFMTQKHQILRDLSAFGAGGTAVNALSNTQLGQELGQAGIADVGNAFSEMVLDSSNMGVKDQIEFLQKHMPEKLAEHLQKTQGMDEKTAQSMAGRIVDQTFGRDKQGNISGAGLDRLIGHVGGVAQRTYGKNLVDLNMFYGNQGDVAGMEEMARSRAHADATKRLVGAGSESTVVGRFSDYFMDIGKRGEKFDAGNFIKEMSPFVADKELLKRYAGEMGAGMHSLYARRDAVSVTDKTIDDLAAAGKTDELKKLAGYKENDKVEVVDDAKLKKERDAKIAAMDAKAATAAYADALGITEKEAALTPIADQKRVLAESSKYAQVADKEYLTERTKETGNQAISMGTLKTNAARSIGHALEGTHASGRSYAEVQSDIDTIIRSQHDGTNKEMRDAAIGSIGRLYKDAGGKAGELAGNQALLTELINADGDAATAKTLETLGLKKEDFEAGKALSPHEKSLKQQMAEDIIGVGRADEKQQLGKVVDQQAAQAGENKQKADKVELAAQNVYINGAKAGGGAVAQTPGSPMPDTKEAIDAEIAAINKKESAFGFGLNWSQMTEADKARREELIKQRDAGAEQAAAAAAGTAGKTADKPLPETKTADKDSATAADIRQQTDEAAVQTVGVSKEEAKAVIAATTSTEPTQKELAQKEYEAAENKRQAMYAALSPAEQAEALYYEKRKQIRKQIDDPKTGVEEREQLQGLDELLQENVVARRMAEDAGIDSSGKVSNDHGHISVGGTPLDPKAFRKHLADFQAGVDRHGDALSPKSRAYELAKMDARKKEIAIKEAEKADIAAKNDAEIQQKAGLEPGEKPVADEGQYTRDNHLNTKNRSVLTPGDDAGVSHNMSGKGKSSYSGAVPPHLRGRSDINDLMQDYAATSGNRLQQSFVAAEIEQKISAGLPPERTADVQQSFAGSLGSANIQPVSYSPEQHSARGGEYTGQAASQGGGDGGSITLNGSLRLEGLHEAILDATAQKAVATPGGGVPVVGTGHMGRGGLPSGQRVT